MKVSALVPVVLLSCNLFGAAPETQLPLWGSDGCSNSPDLKGAVECCDEHDLGYRIGGPWGDWSERGRKVEDIKLALCLMLHREFPEAVAQAYFTAVRKEGRSAWDRNHEAVESAR